MKISNEFTVDVPIARAWAILTDLEGIAPCLPGARLTGVDGDVHQGTVKVKAHTRTQTHAWGRKLKTPKKVRVRAYSYTVNQAARPYLRPTVLNNGATIVKLICQG
mgnify:CR=1 FL=1